MSLKYANELCGLKVAPLLMPLMPNYKEVTESFAAFAAVRDHLPEFHPKDRDVTIIAVGDGSTPRTGATFAMRTAWNVVSIDPALNVSRNTRNIKRLVIDPRRIEDTRTVAKRAIIVAVHSHAYLSDAVRSVTADRLAVVAIQCCVPQTLRTVPDVTYDDHNCTSPQRTIRVWRNYVSE